jgi:hypothetical protein
LERNANSCLNEVDSQPSIAQEYEEKRKKRYQGTPRNIYRHILLSDIKDATATLPQVKKNLNTLIKKVIHSNSLFISKNAGTGRCWCSHVF